MRPLRTDCRHLAVAALAAWHSSRRCGEVGVGSYDLEWPCLPARDATLRPPPISVDVCPAVQECVKPAIERCHL